MSDSTKTEGAPLTDADSNSQAMTKTNEAAEETKLAEPSSEIVGVAETSKTPEPKAQGGCSCGCVCRALVFILTAPILLILLAAGLILWIILLPLKCLCPCFAPCLQALVDAVLWLLRLPVRLLRWVAGKADDGNKAEDKTELVKAEQAQSTYGAAVEKK